MELTKDKEFMMDSKIFAIPADIMTGLGTELFDHIASCLAEFVKDRKLETETLPLGFTFSFPCKQEGLAKASLVRWTKGFTAPESLCPPDHIASCLAEFVKDRKVETETLPLGF